MERVLRILILVLYAILLYTGTHAQVKKQNTFSRRITVAPKPASPNADTTQQVTGTETEEALPPDKERYGPANITFSLASAVRTDVDFDNRELINVFNTIYRDANRNSGYYYYLPAAYNLSWSAGTGEYEFNASYSAANDEGRGETTVTAILKPRLGSNELKLVKSLLQKSLKGKPEEQYGIADLAPMPMAQAPEISFSNLGQFDVAAQDISIRAPSDLLDPIYISFTTTRIDDLMGMFFNNIGLYGDVIVYPAGEGMPATIRIPFNLKIDDPGTFGRFELLPSSWRNGWQNKTDFPIVLTRFNVMKLDKTGDYRVYTWTMGDKEVPEHARVTFDSNLVPRWLDSSADVVRMWVDYSVKPCVSCNSVIKDKIIKGTSASRVNRIEFTVLTPLAFTGADMMKIRARSYQADPNGRSKINLPTITVTEDGSTYSGGELFVPDGAKPDFEYMVQIYMADGTRYESDTWLKSQDLEVVIGSTQIQDMISHFKK